MEPETGALAASATTRVVIVADNSLIVEAIRLGVCRSGQFNLLGRADPRTTSAAIVAAAEPDLILLDDVDGSESTIELVREIESENHGACLVVLTACMERDWLAKVFAAGATTAIAKATHPAALSTLLRETLAGHIVHSFGRPEAIHRQIPVAAAEDLPLTDRELEILRLVAAGLSNGDVARRLWVTEQTVKFHLRNIYRKLEVGNRTEASHFAHINGLVDAGIEGGAQRALTVA